MIINYSLTVSEVIVIKFQITLKAARVNAELTQSEVCKMLKISKTTLVKWEKTNKVSDIVLIALCSIYKIEDPSNIFLNN